ncbi:MAG TPA: 30S ribosomal protein S11 [bacterium]|nr:MAG: 30S ribosomal protein S11 [bacterium ADurb.Bin236]HPI75416.1 30S ribosomal protein S11 [bacterium]HPN93446.1 30S ribosomal protein S11 [bacterium]
MAKKGKTKTRKKITVTEGVVHIKSTFNNTIITVTDMRGNALSTSSAGAVGFKGSRKGTPYAAQLAAENVGKEVGAMGMRTVDIMVKGPGGGRESAIRSFQAQGFNIRLIRDVTPIPHNGCRPKKRRKV